VLESALPAYRELRLYAHKSWTKRMNREQNAWSFSNKVMLVAIAGWLEGLTSPVSSSCRRITSPLRRCADSFVRLSSSLPTGESQSHHGRDVEFLRRSFGHRRFTYCEEFLLFISGPWTAVWGPPWNHHQLPVLAGWGRRVRLSHTRSGL